ncbi:MAG: aminodeoxychorismate/anthranilate synthase component II [Acidobacteriota bacterium]
MNGTALVIDHHDSFVFNLVDDLERAGLATRTVRSELDLSQLDTLLERHDPSLVVLSPGPGHPDAAGVMVPFLRRRLDLPVLGVCLGMQAMARAVGGTLGTTAQPMHGKSSRIVLDDDPLFDGLPRRLRVGRYHSLCVRETGDELVPLARTEDEPAQERVLMAVRHRELPWWGLQFHPESVLTPEGPVVLRNLLRSLPS